MVPVSSRRSIALLVAVVCAVAACGVRTVRMSGDGMAPTLHDGDVRIVNTAAFDSAAPQRGDIVLFQENGERIARIVGLPGEAVTFAGGKVEINGSPVSEPYLQAGTQSEAPQASYSVPAGQYFVLHDNRARMADSRTLGFVPRSAIEGKIG
jgi:signal peptidase I